jgi:hypothetical protein
LNFIFFGNAAGASRFLYLPGRRITRMSDFRKEKICPSSFELVDVAYGEIDGARGLEIAAHLARCEFCLAETEFYLAYPPCEATESAPPIPHALLELAEALIAKETIHISRLEHLLREAA